MGVVNVDLGLSQRAQDPVCSPSLPFRPASFKDVTLIMVFMTCLISENVDLTGIKSNLTF
jgi:hypothetical protein